MHESKVLGSKKIEYPHPQSFAASSLIWEGSTALHSPPWDGIPSKTHLWQPVQSLADVRVLALGSV